MRNLHRRFVLCSDSQIYSGDFAKFCGLLRIYELYLGFLLATHLSNQNYHICFRRASGKCGLCFVPSITITIAANNVAASQVKPNFTYVWFISYSKCSNWRQISKLSLNFGCLFTFCYSAWAN